MSCNHCAITELTVELTLKQQNAAELVQIIHDFLSRHDIPVRIENSNIFTNENGATSIYDFSVDHIQIDDIFFRIHDDEWRPLLEFKEVVEAQWIDKVIQKRQIHCHYQPILNADKSVYAYELLARFTDEEGSIIYPNVIFDAARKRGRLYALDRLCRLTAVRHAIHIPKGIKAFINFIPTSIYSPEFCLRSTTALAEHLALATEKLVFEVVETDKVDDVNHLKTILHYYQDRGFNYALDDVGTGHSTINLLADLQPHVMKLDMKFVQGVAHNKQLQVVAEQFLQKANEIGSIPLAEGIETEEDFDWLKQRGY